MPKFVRALRRRVDQLARTVDLAQLPGRDRVD